MREVPGFGLASVVRHVNIYAEDEAGTVRSRT